TGTTAIQTYLQARLGPPAYPVGTVVPYQHLEASLVALRPRRLGPAALARSAADAEILRGWVEAARRSSTRLVLSSEELSLMRHADEVDRLLDLLATHGAGPFEVVVVRRDPSTYVPSFKLAANIIRKSPHADLVPPPAPREIREGSWLVDHDARVALWSARCTVHVLDYEAEVARRGSIVPAVAAVVGVTASSDDELSRQWLNTSAELQAAVEAAIREKYGVAPPTED
ncbi:MAG: hypothetical protein RJB65_478, partial [Actinomycetota bacterium]